jgi:hypothetical protein
MKAITYLLFILFLSFLSCQSKEKKERLSPDKMTEIIIDLHMADGIMSVHRIRRDLEVEPKEVYDSVLKKHGVNMEQFENSVKYYSKNMKKYTKIYNQVIKHFSQLETEIQKNPTGID